MSHHLRILIRDQLAQQLVAIAGLHVFHSRPETKPLQQAELPALRIYGGDETVENLDLGVSPQLLQRTMAVQIDIVAAATTDLDDALDFKLAAIEETLNASATANTLGGLVKSLTLAECKMELSAEGDIPVGVLHTTWTALYMTAGDDPETPL